MNKFLTESGWKAIVQQSKGKVKDNGLQRALATYGKLPPEKHDEQLKVLSLVFKLGLALNNTKVRIGNPAVEEYLSKMLEACVKEQEAIEKASKAAKVSAGDKIMLQNMVIEAASNVSTNAKANAAFFGRQVVAACTAFQVYSKSKLDDLEDEISAGDLLGPLVAAVTGGVGEVLVAKVSDAIGKRVVQEISKAVGDKMTKRAESIGKDSDDLEKAVHSLVLGATDTATAIEGIVMKTIVPLCDKVIAGVNSGQRLSDGLTTFIEPFVRQQTGNLDAMLEQRFGLPSPAKSKKTQVQIYQDLVKRFEEKLIIANTASGEKMEWNIKGIPSGVHQKAEQRAKQAGKAREQDIGAREAQMGS
jgi:hypothetical protein